MSLGSREGEGDEISDPSEWNAGDAAILATIPLGTGMMVTEPSVTGADAIWWPVIEIDMGGEGYVAEKQFIPVEVE